MSPIGDWLGTGSIFWNSSGNSYFWAKAPPPVRTMISVSSTLTHQLDAAYMRWAFEKGKGISNLEALRAKFYPGHRATTNAERTGRYQGEHSLLLVSGGVHSLIPVDGARVAFAPKARRQTLLNGGNSNSVIMN